MPFEGTIREIDQLFSGYGRVFVRAKCGNRTVLFERGESAWIELGAYVGGGYAEVTSEGSVISVGRNGFLKEWTGTEYKDLERTSIAPPSGDLTGSADGPLFAAYAGPGVARFEGNGPWHLLEGTETLSASDVEYRNGQLWVAHRGASRTTRVSRYDAGLLHEAWAFDGNDAVLLSSSTHMFAIIDVYEGDPGDSWSLLDLYRLEDTTASPLSQLYTHGIGGRCDITGFAVAGQAQLFARCRFGSSSLMFSGEWSRVDGPRIHQLGPVDDPAVLRAVSDTQVFLHDERGTTKRTLPEGYGMLAIAGTPERLVGAGRTSELLAYLGDDDEWHPIDGGWPRRMRLEPKPQVTSMVASGSRVVIQSAAETQPDVTVERRADTALTIHCTLPD